MTRDEIRLECLRLCHRHDHEDFRVVARAKAYEAYVLQEAPSEVVQKTESAETEKKPVGRPKKNSGNVDVLS